MTVQTYQPCRICDQAPAKVTHKGKRGVCVRCRRSRQHTWSKSTDPNARRSNITTGHGLFEATVAALEPLWGPLHTWTRAQHRQHTAWLGRLTGVPVASAPVYDPHEAVIISDISTHLTQRAAS